MSAVTVITGGGTPLQVTLVGVPGLPGPAGSAGLQFKGALPATANLPPTGNRGDAWAIDGVLHVWAESGEWISFGGGPSTPETGERLLPDNSFHIQLANEGRAGVPGQTFSIPGDAVTMPEPSPQVGGFFRLTKNLAEDFENFGPATTAQAAQFKDQRLHLTAGNYLVIPHDYDGAGLMGANAFGLKYWEVGSCAQLGAVNVGVEQYIFSVGTADQHVAVYEDGGKLHARFKNGAYERTLTVGSVEAGVPFGWRLVHKLPTEVTRQMRLVLNTGAALHEASMDGDVALVDVDDMPFTGFAYFLPTGFIEFGRGPTATDVQFWNLYVRNAPMTSDDHANACINPEPYTVTYHVDAYTAFDASASLTKLGAQGAVLWVPDVPPGDYTLRLSRGPYSVASIPFQVLTFLAAQAPLTIDFTQDTSALIRSHLMAANKGWGGKNGGVLAANVQLARDGCRLNCQGDAYSGPLRGVDGRGQLNGINVRMGACVVTKRYFGPGRYRFWIRSTQNTGVCNAIWPFHYEEAYPGEMKFDQIRRDGLHVQGGSEPRIIRNHEIDIEWPTALKNDPDQEEVSFLNARFNTWEGELTSGDVGAPDLWREYTDNILRHGINLGDGRVHELGFDWHLGSNRRVEFYIDGQLIVTNTQHVPTIPGRCWVGVWFPSGRTRWAGKQSNWESDYMLLQKMSIEPFVDQLAYQRLTGESFPNGVFEEIPLP